MQFYCLMMNMQVHFLEITLKLQDNLDKGGRAFLPKSGVVITTFSGGKR